MWEKKMEIRGAGDLPLLEKNSAERGGQITGVRAGI